MAVLMLRYYEVPNMPKDEDYVIDLCDKCSDCADSVNIGSTFWLAIVGGMADAASCQWMLTINSSVLLSNIASDKIQSRCQSWTGD
jgi:hypothetical protein